MSRRSFQQVHKVLIKLKKKADKQKKELLLAKLVVLGASLFVLTWTPYVVSARATAPFNRSILILMLSSSKFEFII